MTLPAHREDNGRFLPGFSPNPGGRPKIVGEIRELARQHAPAAFKRVCELVEDEDPRVALAASQEILNRAYGRPVQAVESEVRTLDLGRFYLEALKIANDPKVINATPTTLPSEIEW